jgi:deoxyribodipyrimidine photo-lyase
MKPKKNASLNLYINTVLRNMSAIVWFQRDLRIKDNEALQYACQNFEHIIPLYILEEKIGGAQKWWLYHSLQNLEKNLHSKGLNLVLKKGDAFEVLRDLIQKHDIKMVCWNKVWEPACLERDKILQKQFDSKVFQGNVLFTPEEIKTKNNDYFKVFTPFWKQCTSKTFSFSSQEIKKYPKTIQEPSNNLDSWNLISKFFGDSFFKYCTPGEDGAWRAFNAFLEKNNDLYQEQRDYPAKNATSHLSSHVHFGEINVKRLFLFPLSKTFASQLGWREFSYHLLYHFPALPWEAFKADFRGWPFENNEGFLRAWQKGETGYPLVDAGMQELWQTGYMHNRMRMLVASFLTKHLLVDWRLGADWFLDTLCDADLAINSASWQWVFGSGCDAAPYFRIFNPTLQIEKFDGNQEYIKKWIGDRKIPPIVSHVEAREKALALYEKIKISNKTSNPLSEI